MIPYIIFSKGSETHYDEMVFCNPGSFLMIENLYDKGYRFSEIITFQTVKAAEKYFIKNFDPNTSGLRKN